MMLMRASLAAGIALIGRCGCEPSPQSAPLPRPSGARGPTDAIAPVAEVDTVQTWLDLIAQRPSAVVDWAGALRVDLGMPAAAKHLSLGTRNAWRLGEVVQGRAAGIIVGRTAALDLPLDGTRAPAFNPARDATPGLAMAIEVCPLADAQRMTVLLNERPLANLVLEPGWRRRTFSLPQDLVDPGENRVRLFFRNIDLDADNVAAAVASIEVASHARIKRPPAAPTQAPYAFEPAPQESPASTLSVRARESTGGLVVRGGVGLSYYVVPPRRGRLGIDVEGHGGLTVSVSTDEDHRLGRRPTRLIEEPLRGTGQSMRADLSAWGGVPVRLRIGVSGEGAAATFSKLQIESPRVVAVDRRARKLRDVIVVTVEGMRRDALVSGARPRLKVLEQLLAESVVFERAYAPSPAAVPTHAVWMTSVPPPRHLTVRGTFVADSHVLLPEALERGGYVRVQATANEDVNERRGLRQGIDSAGNLSEIVDTVSAQTVVADGIERLQSKPGRWYLHLNFNDPQAPYEPPRELIRNLAVPAGAPLPHLTHIWVGRVRLGKTEPSATEVQYIRRLYRGELQVVDDAIGTLRDWLRRERRLEQAIVVVMGAHGEEFYEHGGAGHASTLFEESLRVPLAIYAPALLEPGRVQTPVDLLDVGPTVLDLLGREPPDSWQGRSLVPLIDDPDPPPQAVSAFLGDGSRATVVGPLKLVLGPGRTETFVDLRNNPDEELLPTGKPGNEQQPQTSMPGVEASRQLGVGVRLVRTAMAWELSGAGAWRRARWGTGANLTPTFARDRGM